VRTVRIDNSVLEIVNKHPELPYYSTQSDTFGAKPSVFRVKEFIKMAR
jgi:hypothetical protein